jgi:chromosomal replication initiator protein
MTDWFKKNVDVLLVDDVQFLVNKPKTEETFFTIYESLYSNGKQIVLTSDQHPSKLNGLDDRLKTRFVQGLPLSIRQPEKETCEAILKNRIRESGMALSDFEPGVIDFLAQTFCQNIRELEGALNQLFFNASIYRENPNTPIDMPLALHAVQGLIDVKSTTNKLSAERIVSVVSDYYGLAPYQLTGKLRSAQIANARHVAMYVIRKQLDIPFDKVGEVLGGRDHSTVMSGISKVEKTLKEDRSLQKAIIDIESRLK